MILNDKTIKEGTTLYLLDVLFYKDWEKTIEFTIRKLEVLNFTRYMYNTTQFVLQYKFPMINENLFHNTFGNSACSIDVDDVFGNKKPFVMVQNFKGDFSDEYTYICDSFQTLVKVLQTKTVFNPKSNEATKAKRHKIYRELVRQWTISPYRENFQAVIKYKNIK